MAKTTPMKQGKRAADQNDHEDDVNKKSKMSDEKITFVTGNAKKLEELLKIMGPSFEDKITNKKVNLPEIQGSIDDIIKEKCQVAIKELNGPCIVEDTSLQFKAMNDLPGPYIKWFLDALGNDGLHKMLEGFKDKDNQYDAEAVCTIAYHSGEKESKTEIFKGIIPGKIVAPRGDNKFGWDPVFQPNDYDKTFAEMSSEEKNKVSHRKLAVEKLRKFLSDE